MRSRWTFGSDNMEFKGYSSVDLMGYEDTALPSKKFRNQETQTYNDLVTYFVMSGKQCIAKTLKTDYEAKLEQSRITAAIKRVGARDKCSCCKQGNRIYIVSQPMRDYKKRGQND